MNKKETKAELQERREQVDHLQQLLDECIVALPGSSLGVNWKDLPGRIKELAQELEKLREQNYKKKGMWPK